MSFCSLPCFQAHVPILRHRDAWAEEKRAPTFEQWASERAEPTPEEHKRVVAAASTPDMFEKHAVFRGAPSDADRDLATSHAGGPPAEPNSAAIESDILIVASKLKQYIRARSGMNTSDGVMTALSDIVRGLCDQAIRNAAVAERKTVLDRDFAADKLVLK
jgi:hypothetical protein